MKDSTHRLTVTHAHTHSDTIMLFLFNQPHIWNCRNRSWKLTCGQHQESTRNTCASKLSCSSCRHASADHVMPPWQLKQWLLWFFLIYFFSFVSSSLGLCLLWGESSPNWCENPIFRSHTLNHVACNQKCRVSRNSQTGNIWSWS